jgi:hypothetical protein
MVLFRYKHGLSVENEAPSRLEYSPRLFVRSSTRLPYVRGTKTLTTLPTPRSRKQTTERLTSHVQSPSPGMRTFTNVQRVTYRLRLEGFYSS